ncbi:glycoside hydrolase family 31 protein [Paracidovorax avenae]|uniref:glycoside hydrolase family 31 protein n=1 Tax=Paracidovorax avenae TaxID=80867 RepID=UPI000D2073F0|nr:glycoside hydrolase family 31 protein [Paracidovorax avenae]AVT03480.1 alpha-glucosidase [Paracidovorax avenae]
MKPWNADRWSFDGDDTARTARAPLDDGSALAVRFLSPTMARVTLRPADGFREPRTWAIAPQAGQDTPWEGRSREDISGFDLPVTQADARRFGTGQLTVALGDDPLRLEWHAFGDAAPIASDRETTAYLYQKRGGRIRHYLQRQPGERHYGLGDKTGPLDLSGRRLRSAALDALGYDPKTGDPLYKHWPFVLSRAANGQWMGIYYDTMAECTFDLGCEHDNYHGFYRYVDIEDGDLDYYLMVGRTPAEVIAQFTALIGGTHLPPRWTLGFAQTAMGLTDAANAQAGLDAFIDEMVASRIPMSAFHYGSGYSSRGKRRYVFTWNGDKFPDPKKLNQRFHEHGLRLVANLKPCLLDDHPAYAEVKAQKAFIADASTGAPVIEPFWDGLGSHLDFTTPEGIRWWQEGLRRQVLDYGFDVGWNDNNEYAVTDEEAQCAGFGTPIPMHRARPLHPLLMTRSTFEAQQAHRPGEPVFTVSRGGMPGIQRYAQTWSGDNTTSWETLRWNLRTGLQMSISGMFNVGHDIGGFFGPRPGPELLVRWVQACCLNPRAIVNSWKADGVTTVPWMYPEMTPAIRKAIELRYRLIPYMWSLFERASARHEPIIRPTFYDFPEDANCFEDSDDFMLGDALLAAPVVEPGATTRRVYLPALPGGAHWFDFETREAFASGQWHTVPAPLDRLPLFARAGASIPCAQPAEGQVARFDDPVAETRSF